ncbi:MAG: ATP-binding cassette domain-containing protein [Paracoccaceae bacterium]|nr:ATP-binding cassette domain-containing protein [Paracoccaceae bacterium]
MNSKLPELLAVHELSGGYGDIQVVNGISTRVNAGEVVFITGRNGVGKSTIAKLIAGHLPLASGRVMVCDRDVSAIPAHGRRHLGLGYAPQEDVVFSELTVIENLTLSFPSRSLDRYRTLFERFPFLHGRLTQKAGTLSGGEKKVLSFCRAIAENTKLVVLDEPTEGVQPENIATMSAVVRRLTERGRGFLIVEQNLNLIRETANRVHVLDHGRIVFESLNRPGLRDALISRLRL